jgi:hypothetical protein
VAAASIEQHPAPFDVVSVANAGVTRLELELGRFRRCDDRLRIERYDRTR